MTSRVSAVDQKELVLERPLPFDVAAKARAGRIVQPWCG
jgi:hypothetical protein